MTFKEYIKKNPIDYLETKLDIRGIVLTDIWGIEEYKELKELTLFGILSFKLEFIENNKIKDGISDIEPLKYLTKLEILCLNYNIISDIKPLSNLYNLKKLYIFNNKIKNIDCLKTSNIEQLGIGSNLIENLEPILYMKKLILINSDLNPISNLKIVDLNQSWISGIDLENLKKELIIEKRKRLINLLK